MVTAFDSETDFAEELAQSFEDLFEEATVPFALGSGHCLFA